MIAPNDNWSLHSIGPCMWEIPLIIDKKINIPIPNDLDVTFLEDKKKMKNIAKNIGDTLKCQHKYKWKYFVFIPLRKLINANSTQITYAYNITRRNSL